MLLKLVLFFPQVVAVVNRGEISHIFFLKHVKRNLPRPEWNWDAINCLSHSLHSLENTQRRKKEGGRKSVRISFSFSFATGGVQRRKRGEQTIFVWRNCVGRARMCWCVNRSSLTNGTVTCCAKIRFVCSLSWKSTKCLANLFYDPCSLVTYQYFNCCNRINILLTRKKPYTALAPNTKWA